MIIKIKLDNKYYNGNNHIFFFFEFFNYELIKNFLFNNDFMMIKINYLLILT